MEKFLEVLGQQIAFQKQKKINSTVKGKGWNADYKAGYIAGLRQAKAIYKGK